ncbi:MAG TPA: DUF1028 domain-containing protein [Mycobacteriales bacterium]|jgi:uncharacterized Ntn-hydrolase superfamily protein|nr:DUF1028 domain-containing protein [Mycobacteriales bacterium]
MTFSIVARQGGQWGVAVASKFLAVGAYVPAGRAGAGALATQAMANLAYKADGLALLAEGREAAAVVAALTGPDEEREHRQVGVVGTGTAASYTGGKCIPWAGHRTGDDYAIQGNCLAGPGVVQEAERALARADGPLARRLLAALAAADAAGGDKRGRQSAALLVVEHAGGYGGGSDVVIDLRCDDSPAPVPELARLLDLHDLYFGKPDPATLLPWDEVAGEVGDLLKRLGYDGDEAFEQWLGTENYEERHVPGRIDPVVLGKLREQAAPA